MAKKIYDKESILNCALTLSNEIGIEKISMRLIASRMNCSVTPIYDAFESRSDLVTALFKRIVQQENARGSYLERNNNVLRKGIESPLLYRDIRKLSSELEDAIELYNNSISLMKNESLFEDFPVEVLQSIHFDLMVYITGLVEKSYIDFEGKFSVEEYLYSLKQFTHIITYGYIRALKEENND